MSGATRHILMTTDAVGGVWAYSTQLARALCRRGHRVTLVTMGPAPRHDQRDAIQDVSSELELIVTDLALEWMDPDGEDFQRAAATLLSIADRVRPDLVHLNGYREGVLPWPAPTVVVAHSCVFSWWQACRGGSPSEPRWHRYRAAVQAGLSAADAWVAPSGAFRDTVRQLYAPSASGLVIHNGIEAPCAAPCAKEQIILASGRLWDEAKNLGGLVHTAPALPWPLEIAGPITAPGVGDAAPSPLNTRWLGELAHSALLQRMRQSAIYLAPARYEPFGLGVLEAAAAGCALVLSDIPTLRELWNGAAAFVDPDDTDGLRDVLTGLCQDDERRRKLQHAAIMRAGAYPLANSVSRYCELYDDVLAASALRREEAYA
jgi:glycosyltransferase involved in cell wall biosynthesis